MGEPFAEVKENNSINQIEKSFNLFWYSYLVGSMAHMKISNRRSTRALRIDKLPKPLAGGGQQFLRSGRAFLNWKASKNSQTGWV